jgi:hypothetical protein
MLDLKRRERERITMPDERDVIAAAIQRVLAREQGRPAAAIIHDGAADDHDLPNPSGYALGWLAASVIVSARYRDSAIDAIPVQHPDHGWDRILLTRRVSCNLLADEASNAFGIIDLAAADAPRLTDPDGKVLLPLAELFRADIDEALTRIAAHIPTIGLATGDHATCAHTLAGHYPWLYRVIATLIADHPGLVAARELYVDDQMIDGAYHPLLVHTAQRGSSHRYDWFALQSPTGPAAFVRISGRQCVYRTDRATWASPQQQLADAPAETVRALLRSWLHLDDDAAGPNAV